MEPGPDLSLRNPDRFVSEYRDDAGKLVLRVRVPQQEEGPVDFRWLPSQPYLANGAFTVVRRLGNFEMYRQGTEELVNEFFPPLVLEAPYERADFSGVPEGRELTLAYFNNRSGFQGEWVPFSRQSMGGVAFQRLGDNRGGLLIALLYEWNGCEIACGG